MVTRRNCRGVIITVNIVKSVLLYDDSVGVFCQCALCIDQPLPFVVYASIRVCLTVMLRRAARMSLWEIPSNRPSLGLRLSYRSSVSFGADSWSPVRLYSQPQRCYVFTADRLFGLTLLSIRLCGARFRTSCLWLPPR